MDWRLKGAITDVYNQNGCLSCWAYATTGTIEAHHFIKSGELVKLSDQQLIDCSWDYGNRGCLGGLMSYTYNYIKENGGINSALDYPHDQFMRYCKFNPEKIITSIKGHVKVEKGNEELLAQVIAKIGPVSTGIDARYFQFYKDGIFYEPKCTDKLTHAVVIIGYGSKEFGGDYWIIKNSWGKYWGREGFGKIARNRRNHCGIASKASYPILE